MSKCVKAVSPYQYRGIFNFKLKAYEAWIKIGGQVAKSYYPPRWAHFFAHHIKLPALWRNESEARLRFVQPVTFQFDTFPDCVGYEVIPFLWDTWESYHPLIVDWFRKYHVQTAIFCASQAADMLRECLPEVHLLSITEGVDTSLYAPGKLLSDRSIDLLEYGRPSTTYCNIQLASEYVHLKSQAGVPMFNSDLSFHQALEDAKVTIALPQSLTHPERAEHIETLTQRYWECMLSGIVMVGHAPQDLVNLIGYNPVIELDLESPSKQVQHIISHIDDYQDIVLKNRETALIYGDWKYSMGKVATFLEAHGYRI